MDTRHLIDPELLPMLELMGDLVIEADTLADIRTMFGERFVPPQPDTPPEVVHVPGRRGAPDVALRITRPAAATSTPLSAILHVHGGGFILGSAEAGDLAARRHADLHGTIIASVDYRLAPETPFPGPVEDCHAALVWLAGNAAHLGIDPARIIAMGESAGGGLAAALALFARDLGGPALAGQILIYPMIDDRVGGTDDPWRNPATGHFGWTPANNQFGWASMRGTAQIDPTRLGHFAPARATHLAKLPPALVAVGALDLFVDEDVDYARRLIAAGVPTELHVYRGAPHGFNLVRDAAVTRRFMGDLDDALARMLAKSAAVA
jgi:triacylglycerol lipase